METPGEKYCLYVCVSHMVGAQVLSHPWKISQNLITIFVPKPHSSHVFGPHTILGLSGSDLISLQFGHFLYFFQRSGLLKTNLQSNYMGTPVLASIYAVCCIYPVLHKTLGRLEPLFVQQSIEAGRHLLFTNVLNVFLSITFSSDC